MDAPLICLYVLDENAGTRPLGAASRWWLAQSLRALDGELRKRGGTLVLRRGSTLEIIPQVAAEADARAVYANRICTNADDALAKLLAKSLKGSSIDFIQLHGDLLV